MKKIFIATLVTTIAGFAVAEPYQVNQGLEKIKTNFENSKANKNEYDKNLNIVNKNIDEISKAKAAVVKQKNDVSAEIVKNNESLKKVLVQEKEIQSYIKVEEDKIAAEAKQVQQLEALVAQIKKNQEQRAAIVANYQEQLRVASEEKTAWKSREGELRNQEGETIKVIRGVASEETNWMNRKKGYEIEVKRWTAESEKQQKIFDTYQGLKEEK
jgi:chromosome segregation ATPase